ncbi:hypothetical protein Tsubulata_017996 [Turnera subulata]|uniref:Endonuclease/exonuclease/phosphatase domain-containing protein n=1 Tax=Turnera subulata TaxID=218843 RepID=A0A9Q0JDV1_9ROSI|nr:hypothetical protein Tsubulata_017996 [Turnera subulata]
MVRTHRPDILVLVETWVTYTRVFPFLQTLGFADGVFVDPIGFSGGIWVVWKPNIVQVQVLASSRQYIHMSIHSTADPVWYFTAIYGSPTRELREHLWNDLVALESSTHGPWLLAGDFNAIIDPSEREGRPTANTAVSKRFVEVINHCHLLDLGFSRSQFTFARGSVCKRLDRALCNAAWRNTFDEASVFHLPRTKATYPYGYLFSGHYAHELES